MEWIIVKTVLSLAGVLALMIVVVVVLRKLLVAAHASSSNVVEMKLVGTMMLQPKRSVSVIKVMNKVLIVGITEEGMQPLGEITDELSLKQLDEKIAAQCTAKRWLPVHGTSAFSFARILALQLGRLTAKGAS